MAKVDMGMIREKHKIKNMSIRQSFVLFTFIALFAAIAAITIEMAFFDRLYDSTAAPYVTKYEIAEETGLYTNVQSRKPSGVDGFILNSISTWQLLAVCITVGGIIFGEAVLFYNLKLKKPLKILSDASEKIAENNLDFLIYYDSKDELGRLCCSFEKMRHSLEENNREMWRAMEERKRLNAAFSHDLRTPLTVLRGYSDYLKNYLPQGRVCEEKLISTVSTMSGHIARLENYVNVMGEAQKLEDICVAPEVIGVSPFLEQLNNTAGVLSEGRQLKVKHINCIVQKEMQIDTKIAIQVFENIISNAVRYAENEIVIEYKLRDDVFSISINDDGKGFTSEDLKNASKPFYKSKTNTGGLHFGLGLNICKILCEKHGGGIKIKNGKNGGANIMAEFLCINKNDGIS